MAETNDLARIPSGGGALVYVTDLDAPGLDPDDHHHLARVRRLRDGDPLILGDGAGRWRAAQFRGARPEPVGPVRHQPKPEVSIGVGFALVKGSKPELVVQKLTELGVDHIAPFVARRSVVVWDDAKADAALERWAKVARGAAMQSRQAWLPEVAPVRPFAAVAAAEGACLADRDGDVPTLERPMILVGPEGGWEPEERDIGVPVVALAAPVLRAETAAIVAGALLAALRDGTVSEGRS